MAGEVLLAPSFQCSVQGLAMTASQNGWRHYMANQRVSLRKIREIARLRIGLGYSERQTASSCGVGKATVGDCVKRLVKAGLSWPLPEGLDDAELEAKLYPPAQSVGVKGPTPDCALASLEMKKKGVTRQLLWQEYIEQYPDGLSYSRYCELYLEWLKKSRLSMRQVHKGGEKLFVDFAGTTVAVYDPKTGIARHAQIFVATWGASNYTYAEAMWSQDLPCWTMAHVHAFEFFDCVPHIAVPDNLKSGVTTPCRYDPDLNETYAELAHHYGFAIIPAHVRKPKHKAKVEFSVLLVTRWILAALRKRKFLSLEELNEAIFELLERLNAKPFQKLPGSRQSVFHAVDKPTARPLPATRYTYAEVIKARVNIDYHVAIDDHFYSVPFQLRGEQIRARVAATTIEILHKNRRIYTHKRSYKKWEHTTLPDHMPKAHRAHAEWTPTRIIDWAAKTGANTATLVTTIIAEKPHPEQGYRAALGIIRLGERYGKIRLEAAAARALAFGAHRYRYVKSILERQLDGSLAPPPPTSAPIAHENIRGGSYYLPKKEIDDAERSDDEQA